MRKNGNNYGFSLTEVLLALGTLSIGMIFVAGVFPVAIYFSTQASEQTIAAVVADEAFAKIRLFAVGDPIDPTDDLDFTQLIFNGLTNFEDAFPPGVTIDPGEFSYPSDPTTNVLRRRYWWSALLRRASADPCSPLVQVTVFVCRRTNPSLSYWNPATGAADVDRPVPFAVSVLQVPGEPSELEIDVVPGPPIGTLKTFINDGYAIVHGRTGRVYRVLERYKENPSTPAEEDRILLLDRPFEDGSSVWVIPPPESGGRYPCIVVYQKVIRF